MATPSRERQLIDNVWQYQTVEESGGGGSQATATVFTFTVADVLAWPGTVQANVRVGEAPSALSYVAVAYGIAGNAIAVISDVQPSVGALTVEVSDTVITLHLETDGDSAVLSTVEDVRQALLATPSALALITIAVDPGYTGAALYDVGDAYLGSGASGVSRVDLFTGSAGDVVLDAAAFFPVAWDGGAVFNDNISLFYDGWPDPTNADDYGNPDVPVSNADQIFNRERRIRFAAAYTATIFASCDAGSVPTEGELVLVVDVRTPAQ